MNSDRAIHIIRLLECLSKEGFEQDIFNYAIWKLVCSKLDLSDRKLQRYDCIKRCEQEINKWISEDKI